MQVSGTAMGCGAAQEVQADGAAATVVPQVLQPTGTVGAEKTVPRYWTTLETCAGRCRVWNNPNQLASARDEGNSTPANETRAMSPTDDRFIFLAFSSGARSGKPLEFLAGT